MDFMNNHNEQTTSACDIPASYGDLDRPYFSDAGLDRRIAYSRRKALANASRLAPQVGDPFRTAELRNIVHAAKLTKRQYDVIRLRSRGLTFDEIGRLWNRTKQGAQRVFQQAVRKLRRAQRVYPFAGLNEVYRQEIHRGAIR
jgi:hypothetical protein